MAAAAAPRYHGRALIRQAASGAAARAVAGREVAGGCGGEGSIWTGKNVTDTQPDNNLQSLCTLAANAGAVCALNPIGARRGAVRATRRNRT
jgi:hypothetical protein